MQRRTFLYTLGGSTLLPLVAQEPAGPPSTYEPAWESLRRHPLPAWYDEAKLGIFIHWGLYSVPGWATPTGELGKVDWNKWFYQNPYAEWYLNTLRLKGSPTAEYHAKTYGADYDYYRFADDFVKGVAGWQPEGWARLFKSTGARYVVLTSKHHDGFPLWPSRIANPNRGANFGLKRDVVGELTTAVRSAGMKMALYYSGGLDWTFETKPVANLADLRTTAPQTPAYANYADAHWRELMERYQPAILWNDITYPKNSELTKIVADFYNRTPEGLINNRFGVDFADITTPEYAKYDKITEKKWETCRGLGFSFGYNRQEGPGQVIAADKLIALFVDVVSKNGNLLLNVGPRADGTISDIQTDRLQKLGAWLAVNGEGIFGSKPWVRPGSGDYRFTRKGDSAYAYLLAPPRERTVVIPNVLAEKTTRLRLLGENRDLAWQQRGSDLVVEMAALPTASAIGFQMTPAPAQIVRE